MSLRSGMTVGLLMLVAACGGGESGGMPAGDHVHSLGVTADGGLLLGLHEGLYRSDDGGEGWELSGIRGEDAMVIAGAAADPMFIAGHNVLYRSDDGGETFTSLRPADLPGLDLHAFAQAPSDGEVVYAYAVGFGLFASEDGGETWEQRATAEQLPPDVFGLAAVGSGTETLVLVGPESGVLRSEDGGRRFSRVFDVPAGAVVIDPEVPDSVWALTAAGMARSEDTGSTWEVVSTLIGAARLGGIEGQPVTLAVAQEVLWVVTEQPRALYRSDDDGGSWERVA